MLPSQCCSPFTVEALVLRGLWGEIGESRTLPWKEQERKAKYLASLLPRVGSWDSIGAATGSCGCECWQGFAPCGSMDKHCFLLTVTHRHTYANTHLQANFIQAADIWRYRNSAATHSSRTRKIVIILSFSCCSSQTVTSLSQQSFTAAAFTWTENSQTQLPLTESSNICTLTLQTDRT